MTRIDYVKPIYVEYIPAADSIKEGGLYISLEFQTAVHKCCCGCGEEVVTPLNPAQWQLLDRNGKVTLRPSIGNWSYPCRSHYVITDNRILWAKTFSEAAIKRVQEGDKRALENYIAEKNAAANQGGKGWLYTLVVTLRCNFRKLRDFIFRK